MLCDFRNPTIIITKNRLVTRDIDLLQKLTEFNAVAVAISASVTSLDRKLQRDLEPRASTPENRLLAIRMLAEAKIPGVSVMVKPVIPGLNDHEMPAILKAAAEASATGAGYVVLRLPFAVKSALRAVVGASSAAAHLRRRSSMRSGPLAGGSLNDPRFDTRMRGEGRRRSRSNSCSTFQKDGPDWTGMRRTLSVEAFRRPGRQLALWD